MKKKVLLIDDSMTIHRVIDLSVDEEKYEVEKVFSAEDAEAKIKNFKPDIVLLDNKLEGIKLNEYVSRLKSENNLSVILLVGAFDHFNESNLSATNADDFIIKPFNSSLLEEKLEKFGQKAATDVKDTDSKLKPLVEKDSAVEELLASIDSEKSTGKETQFEDFDDLFTDNTFSKESVLAEDEKNNFEIEEPLEMSESTEEKGELGEPFDLEGIFDDVKNEEKMEEELLDTVLKEEQNEDLAATESDSDDILSDLLEESTKKEDEVISEEASTYKEEYSELSDIFGELEDINDEEEKRLLDEAVSSDNKVSADSLKEIIKDEEALDKEFEESFETVSEIDDNIGKNIDAEEMADELTEDIHDNVEFGADIKEKVMLEEVTEAPIEGEILAENSIKHVQEERLLVDKEMIKKAIEDAIDLDFLRGVVREVISKNLEKVIWEIVPDIAEKLIVEEIERLKKGDIPNE